MDFLNNPDWQLLLRLRRHTLNPDQQRGIDYIQEQQQREQRELAAADRAKAEGGK